MQVQHSLVLQPGMDPEERVASVPSVKFLKVPSPRDLPLWVRIPVYVTHYELPSKLFLRCNLSGHENECIDNTDYYIEDERHHVYEASIGMYCMVALPEDSSRQALRALVTDVRRNVAGIQVLADVLYVDEGRPDVVALDCVYPMNDYEARDPCRSVACCMRRIRPTVESSCYDLQRLLDSSVPYYYDAIFYGLSDGGIYEVDLFINCPDAPAGMQRQSVSQLLVDNGYAEFLDYLIDAPLEDVEPTVDASDHSQPESEVVIEQTLAVRGSTNTENGAIAASEPYVVEGDICPESEVCTGNEICADYGISHARTTINGLVLDRSPSTLSAINGEMLNKSPSTLSTINGEMLNKSPSTLSACSVDSLSDSSLCSELAPFVPKGSTIDIKVTFILTPDHWYGIPTSAVKDLSEVNSIIESCKEVSCVKQQIKKGLYLMYRDLPHETGARVRVEELLGAGKCRVLLVDHGNRKAVKSSCLFKLDSRLRSIAPLALRFKLVDIQPWTQWTEAAVLRFEKLAHSGCSLTAVIVGTSSTGDEFNDTVYLTKLLSETYGDVAECMGLEGYARMPSVKRKKDAVAQNTNLPALAPFNPMQEDYNSPLNSYNVNTDDPGVAAANFSAKTDRICKFFSTRGYCRQNASCVFKHIDAEANSALLHITEPVAECVELQPPEPGSWLLGQMSAYASPNHFYLIFCYGRKTVDRHIMEDGAFSMGETLQSLMDDIQVFCSRGHFLENRLFAKSVGEFVAARSSRDNLWYRAQVVSIGDGDQLKVMFVDFGFSEWLSLNDVKTLDPRFTHLPIQSQLSTLVDTESCRLSDGTGWDKEMCKRFLECVTGETLLIETVCSKEGLLHVKLFFYRDDAIYSVTDFVRNM
uniref:Transcriptional coactivator n=1 Tax=Rhipicephalus zambeziensis TaxID=60191 RepID=A0A224Z1U7_9ACAR